MRKFTSWISLLAAFSILAALYTGLDTITNKTPSPVFHGLIAFISIIIVSISLANSMMYNNTLHREIDDLKKELENLKNQQYSKKKYGKEGTVILESKEENNQKYEKKDG